MKRHSRSYCNCRAILHVRISLPVNSTLHQEIETIAVIGAGVLGCRVAALALRAGYRVVLEDISVSALESGVAAVRETLRREDACTESSTKDAQNLEQGLLSAHTVEDAVRPADVIIETVADELEMKLELFTIFDKFAKPGAILASTTESLSIGDLAEMTMCPERCVGMRLQLDAGRTSHLEIRTGPRTSEQTVMACRTMALRMGLAVSDK